MNATREESIDEQPAGSVPTLPVSTLPVPTLPAWIRVVLSVVFVLHLLAVFIAPMYMEIRAAYGLFPNQAPSVEAGESWPAPWLHRKLSPYLDAAYLNHGYGFFSPDPGPSSIIRYTLELPDGSTKTGQLPDRAEHWPRLFYHRHFMLSSQVNLMVVVVPEEWPNKPTDGGTGRTRPLFVAVDAYALHLLRKYNAKRVKLEHVQHLLARPSEIAVDGLSLNEPSKFQVTGTIIIDQNENVIDEQGRVLRKAGVFPDLASETSDARGRTQRAPSNPEPGGSLRSTPATPMRKPAADGAGVEVQP